jgi:hypothetical protein
VSAFRQQIAAARRGDLVTLRLLRSQEAQRVAFDPQAPALDRLLAAAASGVMQPAVVEEALSGQTELRQEVIDLAGANTGDVTIGQAAGRDIVTIHVYVGEHAEGGRRVE